jgi:hypothetical protein
MIEIKTNGEALDLPKDFSIEIEDSNPIYNDRGSQSIPATVPATRRNIRILDAPHRIDAGVDPNEPEHKVEVINGAYIRSGEMNITEAGITEGITFNIGFDNSTAYKVWNAKKLTELSDLPTYTSTKENQVSAVDAILDDLYSNYKSSDPQETDFAVFPIAVNDESTGSDDSAKTYWEVYNVVGDMGLAQPTSVNRLIDGEVTEVTVPDGYGVTPFLRVWRILELIFADLNLTITSNPFKENLELSRLVVLNNCADAVCRGIISYSDLLPDSTVEEFLNALWVRFGLVYNINYDTQTVKMMLIKDIINQQGVRSLDYISAGYPKITYEAKQYVKLSAQTSIDGAEPSSERFEDFITGLDVAKVHIGTDVSEWQNTGTAYDPVWDGDVRDDYYEDDRDDDRDEDRENNDRDDYDLYSTSESGDSEKNEPDLEGSFLAYEYVTGKWYRLDANNSTVRQSSSSFFNWDPQPEGLTALDLSSDDECVPIERVNTVDLGVGHDFNAKCPAYLFGARHYHTYIASSEDTENSGDETPLAFMFAYTKDKKTIGRNSPEGEDGGTMILDDGTTPKLTLLFQFKDGLFVNFWKEYDEILRHGNRTVEIPIRLNKIELHALDILDVFAIKGIRCLIDTATYTLPAGRDVPVDVKLRTIQTQGAYDITAEQNVPDFATAARHLEWFMSLDEFGDDLDTEYQRSEAAQTYIDDTNYEAHGVEGDNYYVASNGAKFVTATRQTLAWENDTTLPTPTQYGAQCVRTYKADLTYDIYEVHDMTVQGGEDIWELSDEPLGRVVVPADYKVTLIAKWVNN